MVLSWDMRASAFENAIAEKQWLRAVSRDRADALPDEECSRRWKANARACPGLSQNLFWNAAARQAGKSTAAELELGIEPVKAQPGAAVPASAEPSELAKGEASEHA
ncbi:MAG TPA: hypothetical protein VJ750_09530 [Rhizomicrobium sp.]|nr:hypothetical protein [Rhizomicrobium sp.]